MPVVEFHLVEGSLDADQRRRLFAEGSARYAEVLDSPVERIRALVTLRPPESVAIGGVPVAETGAEAVYVTALMLQGRPVEQAQAALRALTDLVVEVLGVARDGVRARVVRVPPEEWAIGGEPAAAVRAQEVQARSGPA